MTEQQPKLRVFDCHARCKSCGNTASWRQTGGDGPPVQGPHCGRCLMGETMYLASWMEINQ